MQANANNPAATGWYAFRHVFHCGANMSPDFAGGMSSFYSFASALLVPGDPGFQATFDAAYANAALGALNPAGLPTQHPVVPTAVGITSFSV